MTIPVDLSQLVIPEKKQVDLRVCRCGHSAARHKPQEGREHGPCQIFSKGGVPRCGCTEWSPIGSTTTLQMWTRGDPNFSNKATAGNVHPFLAALYAGAEIRWLDGEPLCDDCGELIYDKFVVEYLSPSDRRTTVRHAECPE